MSCHSLLEGLCVSALELLHDLASLVELKSRHGLDALGLRNFLLGINVHREEDDIWQEGEGEGKRFVGKEIKKV